MRFSAIGIRIGFGPSTVEGEAIDRRYAHHHEHDNKPDDYLYNEVTLNQ